MVSWSYWQNKFDLDPGILGKRIVVEDVPVTMIGVTARDFPWISSRISVGHLAAACLGFDGPSHRGSGA